MSDTSRESQIGAGSSSRCCWASKLETLDEGAASVQVSLELVLDTRQPLVAGNFQSSITNLCIAQRATNKRGGNINNSRIATRKFVSFEIEIVETVCGKWRVEGVPVKSSHGGGVRLRSKTRIFEDVASEIPSQSLGFSVGMAEAQETATIRGTDWV